LVFLPPVGPVLAFYLLLFTAVPAGIALGTQKKDFYV
jgi:hypothetical protein